MPPSPKSNDASLARPRRVFGTSNQITWSVNKGDPTPVSVTVTNANADVLNGKFSISEFVQISDMSYTVTNVTLRPGPGYVVNFINPKNNSEVYASSSPFEVKPAGTPPYGATVYTVLSFSVSGDQTKTYTLVETSWANSASQTPALTGSGLTTLTASSTSANGAATATLHSGNSSHNAGSSSIQTIRTMAVGLMGALAGAALLL
ncbi:hypothetical protein FRB90_002986 [Tulasnella sp. 427]|nr:hypothetical protein FRB90_002986 [Tulasnella sp. 427]